MTDLQSQLAAALAAQHEAEAKLAMVCAAARRYRKQFDVHGRTTAADCEAIQSLEAAIEQATPNVAAFLDRVRAEGAAEDSELLNWFDRKDRSAHQDGDRWAIWLNTAENSEPISTVGDLRTALRKARAAELEAK